MRPLPLFFSFFNGKRRTIRVCGAKIRQIDGVVDFKQ
jgi:hypothetical protein